MSEDGPKGLFFACSDDEDESMHVDVDLITESDDLEPPNRELDTPPCERLFLPDSEDEDASHVIVPSLATQKRKDAPKDEDSDREIDIPSFEEIPRPSSASSMHEPPTSSPLPLADEPPTKKRRLPSPSHLSTIAPEASSSNVSPFPSKPTFLPAYLGSFIVGNAWSTAKGKGYIKPGDKILVEREDQDVPLTKSKASSKPTGANKNGANGKKQLSIATMLKAPLPKILKKKVDTVVRLSNSRGFGAPGL
jgi:DNA repair protein RAD5